MSSTTLYPEIFWAQRSNATVQEKNLILLTVGVTDLKISKFSLTSDHLELEGSNEDGKYAVKIEFYKPIDVEHSSKHLTGRGYFFHLQKKDKAEEYWPRLTQSKLKHPYIKTDFDRWVDEDEQDEKPEDAAGLDGLGGNQDFDLSQFTSQLGGGNGNMADAFNPEMLAQMSAQQQGNLEDEVAEESLDSVGERINPEESPEEEKDEE